MNTPQTKPRCSIQSLPNAGQARLAWRDGGVDLYVRCPAGLYQFSVVADARRFDFEQLYVPLHDHGNGGQRSGPWDFSLLEKGNPPLVPAYRVSLDAAPIGMWFFQRISLADLATRQFRGNFAVHLREDGEHVLRMEPYRPIDIDWTTATWQTDPLDVLAAPPALRSTAANPPVMRWQDAAQWQSLRERLQRVPAWRAPLERAFAWAMQEDRKPDIAALPLLVAADRLMDQPGAMSRALGLIDHMLAATAWSNPNPDGYSHNGDMGAMIVLRNLAWALHMLGPALGAARRSAMLNKLAGQGDLFMDLSLLNRDYWGGSLLQDHGCQSHWGFACAAVCLHDQLPHAQRWLSWILPRVERMLAVMPRDGVIPQSSYGSPCLYLDEPMHQREAMLALAKRDLLDEGPWQPVVDFMHAALDRGRGQLVFGNEKQDQVPLIGGELFLRRAAQKWNDARAAQMADLARDLPPPRFYHGTEQRGFFLGKWWSFLADAQAMTASAAPFVQPGRDLRFFPDAGLVHHCDDAHQVMLSLRCGPFTGWHAYARATGPCDRLGGVPGSGHFTVTVAGQTLLATPEAGYKLESAQRSILLVDGRGQVGDVGYPMSIPDWQHPGEKVESVQWDAATQRGRVVLDLRPCYGGLSDLTHYHRTFILDEPGRIVCRDVVTFNRPHALAWLFHTRRSFAARLDGAAAVIGQSHGPNLRIEPQVDAFGITPSIAQTAIAWSYASPNHFEPFDHVRFEANAPQQSATIDFIITWSTGTGSTA